MTIGYVGVCMRGYRGGHGGGSAMKGRAELARGNALGIRLLRPEGAR